MVSWHICSFIFSLFSSSYVLFFSTSSPIILGLSPSLTLFFDFIIGDNEDEKSDSSGKKTRLVSNSNDYGAIDQEEDGIELSSNGVSTPRKGKPRSNTMEWEEEGVLTSFQSIQDNKHKEHIKEHLQELYDSMVEMESKAKLLTDTASKAMSKNNIEEISEFIDENVHKTQYKIDHIRRLLQGSEFGNSAAETKNLVTNENSQAMCVRLGVLREAAAHLLEHINAGQFDVDILKEMHAHIDDMDIQLNQFHENVQTTFSRWRRARPLVDPEEGDMIPMGLILPVIVDSIVDGFLIGLSVALSPKAGYILAGANCLEMSFLGMALTVRVMKCTGSSELIRNLSIVSPPFVMLLASTLGALVGMIVLEHHIFFVIFVSFGVVALLFLVCNELLVEAKNIQGEEEIWWITCMIFLGIYIVLISDILLPSDGPS